MITCAVGNLRSLSSAASSVPCTQWSGHKTCVPYDNCAVSNGFLPGWELANDACPAVCQSCVMTMFSNLLANALMSGTTTAPPFTGNVPPSMKQFCTSTTINADLLPGLMCLPDAADAAKALRLPRPK